MSQPVAVNRHFNGVFCAVIFVFNFEVLFEKVMVLSAGGEGRALDPGEKTALRNNAG